MQTSPARRLATVLAIAGLMLLSSNCSLWGTKDEGPQRITVIDYNIFHGLYDEDPAAPDFDRFEDRLNLLAQELSRLKPDILVLQEVVMPGPKGYPDVQAILLAALGGEYKTVFAQAGTDEIGGGGLGRMTLTRLPVVSAASRAVFNGRSAHRVTVQLQGGVLDIYNVHLEGPELVGQQKLEITNLLTFIDASGRNQNPVIVTGDFNSRPGDEAIRAMAGFGFADIEAAKYDVTCAKQGDPGCTRATAPRVADNPKVIQDVRIDYMFGREGADLSLSVIDSRPFLNAPLRDPNGRLLWVSDHIGIQSVLEFSRKK